MVDASCHCGSVRFTIDAAPDEVTDCNCSLCRRYGMLWAYYSPSQVHQLSPNLVTDTYMWDDQSIAFHRCRACGCVTHWAAIDKTRDRMAVNARLFAPAVLAGAKIRRFDGASTGAYLDA